MKSQPRYFLSYAKVSVSSERPIRYSFVLSKSYKNLYFKGMVTCLHCILRVIIISKNRKIGKLSLHFDIPIVQFSFYSLRNKLSTEPCQFLSGRQSFQPRRQTFHGHFRWPRVVLIFFLNVVILRVKQHHALIPINQQENHKLNNIFSNLIITCFSLLKFFKAYTLGKGSILIV